MKITLEISRAVMIIGLLGIFLACTPSAVPGNNRSAANDKISGLYSLDMQSGTLLTTDQALDGLKQFCGKSNIDGYIDRISQNINFNAGYSEHPDSGYDAVVEKRIGDDGKMGYYFGQGNMSTGSEGLAMFPSQNRLDKIVYAYCRTVVNSLNPRLLSADNSCEGCKYESVEVSSGGSVNGTASNGQIGNSNCLVARMQNQQFKSNFEVAFCQDEMAANLKVDDITSNEMSMILTSRGGGRNGSSSNFDSSNNDYSLTSAH